MNKIRFLAIFLLFISCSKNSSTSSNSTAGNKQITLEEIWDTTFLPESMNALNSMNGDFYSLLNLNAENLEATVDMYSYKTLEKVKTIVSSKNLEALDVFTSYSFNNDETQLVLGTNFEKVYRHSFKGTFYTYHIASKKLTLIGEGIQEPTFSPDSKKVAYAKDNNLYIKNLTNNRVTKVTKDGKKNRIINGTTDWVYEEEFAFVRAFEWSNNSKYIAFLRFNETEVPQFSMDVVGNETYPTQQVFKYPKAGEKNAKVSLHMYNVSTRKTKKVGLKNYEYIPRIKWSNKDSDLFVSTLNRHQNDLKLYKVDANTTKTTIVLNEKDAAYVDIHDNLTFLDDHSFIWTSEKDGYNHIYHYTASGKLINQVTKGNWEVTNYYGFNKEKNTIYYQSVENGSINRGVYAIGLDGNNKKLLSNKDGQNQAAFSKNLNYFINTHSTSETPPVYSLYTGEGEKIKVIVDNADLKEQVAEYKISQKEFSTISINGNDLNMWMLKPVDFDPNKKYPLLLYQYSGPGSQQVGNKWNNTNDYWHNMLAQEGMIVACVDGRGTGFKGSEFKKSTYLNLVKYETEDQIAVAKKLAERSYIDSNNIGIWGWSFGGHMSTNCILKGNDIFTTAIAVAPVTSWRFYDTIYTERFLRTPQENPAGYDENSPINYAEKLQGNYLLVHGTGDDNVHVQNSFRMTNALIDANKQFDQFIVPDRSHGIRKGATMRLNLYTKMTHFLRNNLLN